MALLDCRHRSITFAALKRESFSKESISEVAFAVGDSVVHVRLRSLQDILRFLEHGSYTAIYLDVTGLEHQVWAPLLRGMAAIESRSFCVYVEPGDYQFSSSPTELRFFEPE